MQNILIKDPYLESNHKKADVRSDLRHHSISYQEPSHSKIITDQFITDVHKNR